MASLVIFTPRLQRSPDMDEPSIPPVSSPVSRGLELISRGLFTIATGLMLVIVVLLVAQIAARNFWNIGLPKAEEATRLAGILTVYLTAPLLALKGQHVAVDIFVNIMPRLPKLVCHILAELSVAAFSILSIYAGWLYLQRAWKFKTPAIGLQNFWLFSPIVACFCLLVIISLWRIWNLVKTERSET